MLPDHVIVFHYVIRRPPVSLCEREIDFVGRKGGLRLEARKIVDGEAGSITNDKTALTEMAVFELLEMSIANEVCAALLKKGQNALTIAINVEWIETLIQHHNVLGGGVGPAEKSVALWMRKTITRSSESEWFSKSASDGV